MAYLGAEPYSTNIPPGSNIPLSALDSATQATINGKVNKSGDTMTGVLTMGVQSAQPNYAYPIRFGTLSAGINYNVSTKALYFTDSTNAYSNFSVDDSGNTAVRGTFTGTTGAFSGAVTASAHIASQGSMAFRIISGNYGAAWHSDDTNYYLLSTASGSASGTFNSYRPFVYTLANGQLQLGASGQLVTLGIAGGAGPLVACNAGMTIQSSGQYSFLYLNAGGYTPNIRSNNGNSTIEFVNNGSTAVNFSVTDGGNVFWRGGLQATGAATFSSTINVAGTLTGNAATLSQVGTQAVRGAASGGALMNSSGGVLSWNEGNGDGAGWLTCNQGGGAGGWIIRTINSNNSAEIGRFVISGSGTGTSGSDWRLKENVATLDDALNKVCQLRGVSFNYIATGERHYGVIAQEVQPIYPDAVTTMGAGEGKEDYLGVAYTDLIAPLIESVKSLKLQLDAATAEIAALKARVG